MTSRSTFRPARVSAISSSRPTAFRKAYGDTVLFENLEFSLPKGGIVGVIGPNGAGKTTLFRLITGQETADSGVFKVGETVKLGYVDQSRDRLDAEKNVFDEISDGLDNVTLGTRTMNARTYVSKFNFSGADQQKFVGQLSGGERNRVHLAKMLKTGANVLLLDEPTNDIDVNTMRALEEALENFAGCAVVISHDRWFLDRIATHILAFEGDSHVEYFDGNYSEYEEDRKRRLGHDADQPHRIKYRSLTQSMIGIGRASQSIESEKRKKRKSENVKKCEKVRHIQRFFSPEEHEWHQRNSQAVSHCDTRRVSQRFHRGHR